MKILQAFAALSTFVSTRVTGLSLPATPYLQTLKIVNVTSSEPSLTAGNVIDAFCASSQPWTGGSPLDMRFFYNCFKANNYFFKIAVGNHGDTEFEFLNYTTPPVHDNPLQRTPIRYTFSES